jgi:hypothetical protein
MKFPFVLIPQLTRAQKQRYQRHIDSNESGWYRRFTESIWRRHQHPSNALLSGWRDPGDRRRRLIHFYDEYGLEGDSFVLRNAYLWVNLTLPDQDIEGYRALFSGNIERGGWERRGRTGDEESWHRGDLVVRAAVRRIHLEDRQRGVEFPPGYLNFEVTVWTRNYQYPATLPRRPWRWFYEVGLRQIVRRGNPWLVDPEQIASCLPVQVELGCGPSTEAGIPHLSTLHRIYSVSRADFGFVFKPEDDIVFQLFADPERKYAEMTDIYRACMVAEATPFYSALRDLADRGLVVGPIITNNFDCLCADSGLEEVSLRRYDTEPYFPALCGNECPSIQFDPRARALLVVGVHADRRLAQMRARESGLRIIYIDPERYLAPDGGAIPYPVEAPQDQDWLVRMTAGEAMPRLHQAVVGRPVLATA